MPPGRCYRAQRLRHTFSSPEAFSADELHLPYPDFLSYGTNLPHDRSSSNFGSELLRDPSSYSVGKRARMITSETSDSDTITNDLENSNRILQTHTSELTTSNHSESDSEAEQQVSCFGAQRPKRRHRGHVRSRSFSNARAGGSAGRRRLIQRSSSADLLMNYATMAVSTPQKRADGTQRLFFI
ncbi:hypothetical protein KR067_013423 [Drosophila pandora]|nr:hypothetical protein KR067_013423 [Drosophila pandora]